MSPQEREGGIRRILVSVDASSQSLTALRVAASLATRLDTEVIGIFVEDINLLRLAEMPFIQEVGYFSARSYPMSSQGIERQLRSSNRWLQQVFQMLSSNTNIRWSLRTIRGSIAAELLDSVLDTDLLILGRTGLPGMRQVGPIVRSLINRAPTQSLIINRPVRPGTRVIILYDGSASSQKALLACELVIAPENPVIVLIIAPDFEQAQRLQAQAQAELVAATNRTRYHWLRGADAILLAQLARREECGVLVLPAESDALPVDSLLALLDRTDCSVLLVH
ncbi:MAG TPA: universal stress protein [Anaerolineales bacterium]|nr:universal stress protein [Anaerolineales bacterium]